MKTKPFTDSEKGEVIRAAKVAVEDESPWEQLGAYFRAQREKVEPRPTRENK